MKDELQNAIFKMLWKPLIIDSIMLSMIVVLSCNIKHLNRQWENAQGNAIFSLLSEFFKKILLQGFFNPCCFKFF